MVSKKNLHSLELGEARPFLKWAGGKTQLLGSLKDALPRNIYHSTFTYVEPFVGSGAFLFWMLHSFPNMKKAVINDINSDLINTYKVISNHVFDLIELLSLYQNEYHILQDQTEQKNYYYAKRDLYNLHLVSDIEQAALFIFLNRTCFNGLYRVNRDNLFNVPIGSYKKPTICDSKNLKKVSEVLKKVEILNGDFSKTLSHANPNSFFYFDPPYKPLSETSSFNSYTKQDFGDNEQIRLRDFCITIDELGHRWMLSNSDVRDKKPTDNFFDDLFGNYNITRVKAKRMINANPDKRGELFELLITNYRNEQALSVA